MPSVRVSFDHLSVDYLKLIKQKIEAAKKYPSITKEINLMKTYYKNLDGLIKDIDENLQAYRFQSVNQNAMIQLLNKDLENEMRKNVTKFLEQPTQEHLDMMRKRYKSGEPNVIAKASEFYFLTDEQVKYILNE